MSKATKEDSQQQLTKTSESAKLLAGCKEMAEKVEYLRRMIKSKDTDIEELSKEIGKVDEVLQQNELYTVNLSLEITERQMEILRLSDIQTDLDGQHVQLGQRYEALKRVFAADHSTILTIAKQSLNSHLADSIQESPKKSPDSPTQLEESSLKNLVKLKEKSILKLRDSIHSHAKKIEKIKGDIDQYKSNIQRLKQRIEPKDKIIEELKEELNDYNSKIKVMLQDFDAKSRRSSRKEQAILVLEEILSQKDEYIARLMKELGEYEARNSELQKLMELGKEQKVYRKSVDEAEKTIGEKNYQAKRPKK